MLLCFYYLTWTAMLGGFLWVLLGVGLFGAEGSGKKEGRLSNSLLYTVNCNFQMKEKHPPTIPSHCRNKIQVLCISFCSIQLPLLHINGIYCLPSQKSQTHFMNDSLSPHGYKRSHKLFHYTRSKDISTILKGQVKV